MCHLTRPGLPSHVPPRRTRKYYHSQTRSSAMSKGGEKITTSFLQLCNEFDKPLPYSLHWDAQVCVVLCVGELTNRPAFHINGTFLFDF